MRKPTVKVGVVFRWTLADGKPRWVVKEARGRGTWLCEVPEDEIDFGGTQKSFLTEEIQSALAQEAYWKQSGDESKDFYARLQPGTNVHYRNSGKAYVRCLVMEDHKIKPVALVGEWNQWDLPRRYKNGRVELGYWAKQIVEGKTMQPHCSQVYEFKRQQWDVPDILSLQPIDLTVPEMTPEQRSLSIKLQHLEAIQKAVSEGFEDPDATIAKVEEIITSYKI